MSIKTIKCCRCNGSGLYGGERRCFRCNGAGVVIADVFLRAIGINGEFFGVTGPIINGKRHKSITRNVDDLMDGYTAKVITETQARQFFKRYGLTAEVPA